MRIKKLILPMSIILFIALGIICALCLGGCVPPDDLPAYLSDGKTVVAFADDGSGKKLLWTYDLATQAVAAIRPPKGWEFLQAKMYAGQIWVQFAHPKEAPPGEYDESSIQRFDAVKREFIPGPQEMQHYRGLDHPWVPASFEGRKCVLTTDWDMGDFDYDVFSFPDFKMIKPIRLGALLGAGNFWSVQISTKKWKHPEELERVDVYDPDGKKTTSITPGAKENVDDIPKYARVSDDGKGLLLVFAERHGVYGFKVFDKTSGKLLWGHIGDRVFPSIFGTPLVKSSEIWTMEFSKNRSAVNLVRYTPGPDSDLMKANHEVVLTYPVQVNEDVDQFTPSPDGSHFVMVVNGKPSRLLLIPIRNNLTDKDIRVVELTERNALPK